MIMTDARRGLITACVMLATIMQVLDTTIANVALPYMQGSLAGTQDQMAWVLTSYIVAAAIATPLVGWLSGQVGRKIIFLVSIFGFVVASILCGLAVSLPEMVTFRLLQGLMGAALVPLSQAVLLDINTKENIGKAMALWGVGVTLGPILGPALGGWLTQEYSWRWVFYINVPIGVFAFFGLSFGLSDTKFERRYFDFIGFFSLSLCVAGLQLMLDRGEWKDWFHSPEVVVEGIACLFGLYLLIVHSLTLKNKPLFLNPQLFQDRNFIVGCTLIFVVGMILFASLALTPPMLQNQLNYPILTTGLVIAPRGIGMMMAMYFVGSIIKHIEVKYIIAVGLLLTAYSLWVMTSYSLRTDMKAIIVPGILQGFGVGLCYVPLSAAAFSTLPSVMRNEGAAFFNLLRNLGGSIGISVVEVLLTENTQILHASLSQHVIDYNAQNNIALLRHHIDLYSTKGVMLLNGMITNQAVMIAYLDDYKLMMLLTLAALPFAFLFQNTRETEASTMVMD